MSRVALVTASAIVVMSVVGCGQAPRGRVEAEMSALTFAPGTLTATVGDTVVWVNRDLVPHTVRWDGLSSGAIAAGESFPFLTNAPVQVQYTCDYHPGMRGRLEVVQR